MKITSLAVPVVLLLTLSPIMLGIGGIDAPIGIVTEPNADGYMKEEPTTQLLATAFGGAFIENMGQLKNEDSMFYARGDPMSVLFGESKVTYRIDGSVGPQGKEGVSIEQSFVSANLVTPEGNALKVQRTNYLLGNDPDRWITGARSYQTIYYEGLWQGIDLRFDQGDGLLKYEFLVSPCANPNEILMAYQGLEGLNIDPVTGELVLRTTTGILRDQAPLTFQGENGSRVFVHCEYRIVDPCTVGFVLGEYDDSKTLIIDPGLEFSTYFGGSGDESPYRFFSPIDLDSSGSIFIGGVSLSSDLPTTSGAYCETFKKNGTTGAKDGFIAKLNHNGTQVKFCTYFGGFGDDILNSLKVDSQGNVYAVGYTRSTDFPVTNDAYCKTVSDSEGFILKLSSDGAYLTYSTVIGGSGSDSIKDLIIGADGKLYMYGGTTSSDLPTTSGAYDTTYNDNGDVALLIFSIDNSSLEFGSYLGGSSTDFGYNMEMDSHGNIFVVGETSSRDFPTTNGAFCETNNGMDDGFIAKINPKTGSMIYCSYIGSDKDETIYDIFLDMNETAWVCGVTRSRTFPTTDGAWQEDYISFANILGFMAHFSSDGSSLDYCTYISWGRSIQLYRMALWKNGTMFLSGVTSDSQHECPVNAIDPTYNDDGDLVFFWVDLVNETIFNATYLGGSSTEGFTGMDAILKDNGQLIVFGCTQSSDYPTTPGAIKNTTVITPSNYFVTGFTMGVADALSEPPTNVTATGLNRSINLTWDPPKSSGDWPIREYRLYRGMTPGEETYYMSRGWFFERWFQFNGLANGMTYYYRVSVVTAMGESELSPSINATPFAVPTPPRNFAATGIEKQVYLSWLAPTNDGGFRDLTYRIHRGTGGSGLIPLFELNDSLDYYDGEVIPGVTYYYQIQAVHPFANGTLTGIETAMPYWVPAPVTVLTARGGPGQVSIEWIMPYNNGSPITGVKLYQGHDEENLSNVRELGPVTNYWDREVVNGTKYFYAVSTVNSAGEGNLSMVVNATPMGRPSSVRGLAITAGDGTISVSWDAPANDGGSPIIGYWLSKGISEDDMGPFWDLGGVTSYRDEDVINGQTYYYKVLAYNIVGEGPDSDILSATPGGLPDATQVLTMVEGDGSITITWSTPEEDGGWEITTYFVYRGEAPDTMDKVGETESLQRTFNDSGLVNGRTYHYVITAINAVGEGEASAIVSGSPAGQPGAPVDLSATASVDQAVLVWGPPEDDGGRTLSSYRVYRSEVGGSMELIATVDSHEYTDTPLESGRTYRYTVTASNAKGLEGDFAPVVEVTLLTPPIPTPPGMPRDLKVTVDGTSVNLTWNNPVNDGGSPITGYKVLRGKTRNDLNEIASMGVDQTFSDTGLDDDTTYYYSIVAINDIGAGDQITAREAVIPKELVDPDPDPDPEPEPDQEEETPGFQVLVTVLVLWLAVTLINMARRRY